MQYTLYIRKENDEIFKDEENKSELVNALLEKHYGRLPVIAKVITRDDPIATSPEPEELVAKAVEQKKSEGNGVGHGLCKIHNVPLTPLGKCLQKGCKYN